MKGWEENDAFEEIDFDDASLDHPILELAELFSVKRDGRYKLRLIALELPAGADIPCAASSLYAAATLRPRSRLIQSQIQILIQIHCL
jgi:hypothetical protein